MKKTLNLIIITSILASASSTMAMNRDVVALPEEVVKIKCPNLRKIQINERVRLARYSVASTESEFGGSFDIINQIKSRLEEDAKYGYPFRYYSFF